MSGFCVAAAVLRSFRRGLQTTKLSGRIHRRINVKHKQVTDPMLQDPEYFEKKARELPIDDNYIDALDKLYLEKLGSERELMLKGDDHLIGRDHSEWVPKIDKSAPRVEYADVDALVTAPDTVKRIFSIEFGTRKDLSNAWKKVLIDKVKKHSLDHYSLEMKIAWATSLIRNWSVLVDEINGKPRKPKWLLHRLKLLIDYRRRCLRELRESDSNAFEDILSKLQIAYHVPPLPEQRVEKRRTAWIEAQLMERVEKEKERRLQELHLTFLKDRERVEAEIDEKLKSLAEEEDSITKRLSELADIEGRPETDPLRVIPKYEPPLIDSMTERNLHIELFYHPHPRLQS
ncbi:hypothetical protein AB6A40_008327 [Gnathostoma spinigerum]|uniref:Small ribosomal subunit protein uS15m n=1 Tax=Gnathostoma spinigerum TaxID=75299 RepID=A0ABD6EP27_9BILA